jgi:hypothetical protein
MSSDATTGTGPAVTKRRSSAGVKQYGLGDLLDAQVAWTVQDGGDPGARHLPAGKRFNTHVKGTGDVGIRTRPTSRAGQYEAIYGDMPCVGLAAAGRHVPIARKGHTAARRVGCRDCDVVAAPARLLDRIRVDRAPCPLDHAVHRVLDLL